MTVKGKISSSQESIPMPYKNTLLSLLNDFISDMTFQDNGMLYGFPYLILIFRKTLSF